MEASELVRVTKVVELSASTRVDAIRALVESIDWRTEGLSPADVIAAVEERELTAQTIVTEGMALPHATLDWPGDFVILLGRSRSGIAYGAAGERVHLVLLLVSGARGTKRHVEILAAVAELFRSPTFRQELVDAPDARSVEQVLRGKAGLQAESHSRTPHSISLHSLVLIEHAVQMTAALKAQALLLTVDRVESVPWVPLMVWSGRLLVVATEEARERLIDRPDTHVFVIPHAGLSRTDRARLGLLLAASNGLVDSKTEVVCVTGLPGSPLDSITVAKPSAHLYAVFEGAGSHGSTRVSPAVLLRVLSLAIELASEGREGQPVGTMFVLGDSRRVAKYSQQLILNPFHGFSRELRNVLDPSLAETIKELALIDGAFVVRSDGTVLSAGTYMVSRSQVSGLPGGLGARHQAAAAITAQTKSLAITISESTGTVTVFQGGGIVLTLERAALTQL